MEKKKFIIEVEEGRTECNPECPLMVDGECVDVYEGVANIIHFLQCSKYNLATMKITKNGGKEMKKKKKMKMKMKIAGVIIFLFLLTVAFVTLIFDKGGFDWSLLSVAFSSVVIAIVISVITAGIVYLLLKWIEK